MTVLLAASSATATSATEGDVKAFLTNLRDYMADLLGSDSTNKAAVLGLMGALLNGKSDKSSSYTVVAGDRGKVINCTGTWTLSITSAATLGDGFCFAVRNNGSGAITIDPSSSETINGQITHVIGAGEFVVIYCDGVAFSLVGGSSLPAGSMVDFGGASAPVGWLLCYGQAVSRTSYSALFTSIGTTYGAGDGSTTFNLPDFRGRVSAGKDNMGGTAANRLTSGGSGVSGTTLGATGGAETHTLTTAQMPAHSHGLADSQTAGGYSVTAANPGGPLGATSTASAGGGAAHNNTQPTLVVNKIIKT